MPRLGERIGDAYVRIHADGSSFGDDLRSDLDSASIGEDEGKAFDKGFKKGFNPKFDDDKFLKSFDRAIGRMAGRLSRLDVVRDGLRDALESGFSIALDGDLGKRLADNLIGDLEDGLRDFTSQSLFGDLERQVIRARKDVNAQWQGMLDEATKMNEEFLLKQSQDYDKAFDLRIKQLERLAVQGRITAQAFETSESRLRLMFNRVRGSLTDLHQFEESWDRISDSIGRATGRGSRNNFLNFIGSINRNLTRTLGNLITLGPRIAGAFKGAFDEFSNLRKQGTSFGTAMTSVMAGLLATVASGVPGLIAMAAGFGLLITTAGLLATVLSGLLAILTALVATISFAVVGALGALLGALLPIGAAIGVIVAGFVSLDEAQKKALKNDLQPLINSFKDLGKAAGEELFQDVDTWSQRLAPLIAGFEPAVRGVARAIRDSIGQAIEEASTSPGFDRFQRQFNKFLPDAVKSLSDSIFNFGGAMGGVFTALIPITREFLTWLEDITGEFSEWANSKQGQKELKNFFSDASDSVKALGEFLKQTGKFLGELLSQSRGEGDSLFRDMASAMADLVKWATSPEGQDAIDRWLAFGVKLGDSLGDAFVAALNLWDALDTPENREFVLTLVDGFTKFINLISKAPGLILFLFAPLVGLVDLVRQIDFGKAIQGVGRFIGLVTGIGPALQAVKFLPDIASRAKKGVEDLLKDIGNLIARIPGVPRLVNIFSDPARALKALLKDIGDLISKIPGVPKLPNLFKVAVDAANTLLGIIKDIASFLSKPFSVNIDWPSPPSWLSKIPGLGGLASGGIVSGAQRRLVGEEGPEAVVPLNRPLTMVDPSVRWLSALAQGLAVPGGSGDGSSGRQITIPEINVVSSAEDPAAVAREVFNIIVGSGY